MQINSSSFLLRFILGIVLFNLISCSVTKKLIDDQTVLVKNDIYINGELKNDEILHTYLKQHPKSSYFGLKYSPIIFSQKKLKQSEKQLKLYYNNISYFNNTVRSEVVTKKKRTKVKYYITTNEPYTIDKMDYSSISDTSIVNIIKETTFPDQIKPGDNYDYWGLEKQINTIYQNLLENGYYSIKKSDLGFYADTINKKQSIDLEYYLDSLKSDVDKHNPFYFRNTTIKLLGYENSVNTQIDTFYFDQIKIIAPIDSFPINKNTLLSCILFNSGDTYKRTDVDNSYSKLNNLNIFERIRITLTQVKSDSLDCVIEMHKRLKIADIFSLEGIHTSGIYGLSGKLTHEDRNLLKGAESLKIQVSGLAEHQGAEEDNSPLFNSFTYSGDLSLTFPKILSPVNVDLLLDPSKRVNTIFSLGYNRLDRPSLGRTIVNFKTGYQWQEGKFNHLLNPVEISSVFIDEGSDLEGISGTNIQQLYSNFLITSTNYSFEYNDQNPKKIKDENLISAKIEFSGNILNAIAETTNLMQTNANDFNLLFKNVFTQFVKLDFNYRHYFVFNNNHQIATRTLLGLGLPYGNSTAMPFQKQYFIGGSNDVRGFNSYSVGPGSYPGSHAIDFLTADVKLQASAEYRFTISKGLKGACFVDVGNIWELKENKDENGIILKPGAQFKWDKFYKEFASSIGIGIRYDFDFLVFRIDFSHPMYDPSVRVNNPDYNSANPSSQEFNSASIRKRWQLNKLRLLDMKLGIGIGYPF